MSKGLGTRQLLFLRVLADLEHERGDDRHFRISFVIRRAYHAASDLVEAERQRGADIEEGRERLKKEADEGNKLSWQLLVLGDLIRGEANRRNRLGRKKERRVPRQVEDAVNPSRILTSLEKRGLVRRGSGYVGLTPEGRIQATRAGSDILSGPDPK
jgi:hypothetical protein